MSFFVIFFSFFYWWWECTCDNSALVEAGGQLIRINYFQSNDFYYNIFIQIYHHTFLLFTSYLPDPMMISFFSTIVPPSEFMSHIVHHTHFPHPPPFSQPLLYFHLLHIHIQRKRARCIHVYTHGDVYKCKSIFHI